MIFFSPVFVVEQHLYENVIKNVSEEPSVTWK